MTDYEEELFQPIKVEEQVKYDSESQLIFNQLNNLKTDTQKFEVAISKLIYEKTENFYLQPDFWNYLNEEEKKIITNGKNLEKLFSLRKKQNLK